ncbi:MAG: hypothetical protein KA715_09055 [Xanthomonadaceae bacterium]|nr:hypothetical protein [Xanthomonadaceae bacterium]
MFNRFAILFSLIISSSFISGCGMNIFSPIDGPSGDEQLMSAARACLDQGDATCALAFYNRMSGSGVDIKQSEGAFSTMYQQGATFGVFLTSFGSTASLAGVGRMANSIVSGAGSSKRQNLWAAYKRADTINNTTTKNFTKFVTSLALTAAILAETAGSDSRVTNGDLVTNATACAALPNNCTPGNHAGTYAPVCGAGTSSLLDSVTVIDLDTTDNATVGGQLNVMLFNAAVSKLSTALLALGSGGSFGSFGSTSGTLAGIAIATLPACYRYELLRLGMVPVQ